MIKIESLAYQYETKCVLDKLSFEIKAGEKVVLLGNNGSGKSTLLRILAGLYFGEGNYFYKDQLITKKSVGKNFRKEIGILFQNPETMMFNPTVYDEIAFGLREFDITNVDERVREIADKFRLTHHLQSSPLKLSGGEKQKVMLCAILALEPQFLLLDEPTANMDPKTTGWFVDLLSGMNITTLISTHNISLAYELGDKALVLNDKHQLIYNGEIEALMRDKKTLIEGNLLHLHAHKHKDFQHSHYHMHHF
ncbi:energy-coupling factor ABC transporter ATP-binding protein [Sulfurospirillum arsenophilum]|uniref:energy-coupling factor ABC transporter ATP-binding protein n=1 Tax=Sulfurospirillum arsenophilum TaxID=56698 RepID=UPI0005A7FD24|nr:ABC transporter ATP-binding protein [Sulfurospirillum arsenophilum]